MLGTGRARQKCNLSTESGPCGGSCNAPPSTLLHPHLLHPPLWCINTLYMNAKIRSRLAECLFSGNTRVADTIAMDVGRDRYMFWWFLFDRAICIRQRITFGCTSTIVIVLPAELHIYRIKHASA
jgi:hypothetical protein